MQARKGEEPKKLRVYNLKERAEIDKELTDRSVDFMERQVKAGKPFFLFLPYTQTHMPVTAHPDFKGKTGNGEFADVLAQIPAGKVSDEIVHEMDLFPTFAHVAGGKVPSDRVIDGVNQYDFFAGKQQKSNRESVVIYLGNEIFGVKWRNWKMMTKELQANVKPY